MRSLLVRLIGQIWRQIHASGFRQSCLGVIRLLWKLFSGRNPSHQLPKQARTFSNKPEQNINDDDVFMVARIEDSNASVVTTISASQQPQTPVILSVTPEISVSPTSNTDTLNVQSFLTPNLTRTANDRASRPTPRVNTSTSRNSQITPSRPQAQFNPPNSAGLLSARTPYPGSGVLALAPTTKHEGSPAHQIEFDRVSRVGSQVSAVKSNPPTVDRSTGGILALVEVAQSSTESNEYNVNEGNGPNSVAESSSTQSTVAPGTKESGYEPAIIETAEIKSISTLVETARILSNVAIPAGYSAQSAIMPSALPGAFDNVYPFDTENIAWLRYYDRPTTEKGEMSELILPKTELKYSSLPPYDMAGWVSYIHPEGDRYFYHPECKFYTRTDLHVYEFFEKIQYYMKTLEDHIRSREGIPKDIECVIQLTHDPDSLTSIPYLPTWGCAYYLVDNSNRLLFWMTSYPKKYTENPLSGVKDPVHIRFAVEMLYWQHIELHPEPRELDQKLVSECIGILAHAGYDSATSTASTAPYGTDQLQQQLAFIKSLKAACNTGGYSMCVLGRIMGIFIREKYFNFAGQPCARLSRDQRVYETKPRRRSLLINIFSPLLFFVPEVHLKNLEKIWVDEIIWEVPWRAFMKKLRDEWTEFILYSTVLLAVNTAVLAIPSVDKGEEVNRNPTQILCYISILCSVATILLGLLVSRQYRESDRETAKGALGHLKVHENGLETLSIMYSLPYASLMWAMITFFGALSCMFFIGTTWPPRLTMLIVEVFVVGLVFWCLAVGGKKEKRWWFRQQIEKLEKMGERYWPSKKADLNGSEMYGQHINVAVPGHQYAMSGSYHRITPMPGEEV